MTVIIIAKNSSVGKKKLLTSDSYFIGKIAEKAV